MPQLRLMLPEHPGESGLDTIPFVLAAAAGNFMALGAGYDEAKAEITWQELSRGFSLGVVMGASGVSPKKAAAYFGHRYFARNVFLEGGAQTAAEAYKKGLLNGYAQGRALSQGQRKVLAGDLRAHAETLPGWHDFRSETQESAKQWSDRTWTEYYLFLGGVFRLFHLSES